MGSAETAWASKVADKLGSVLITVRINRAIIPVDYCQNLVEAHPKYDTKAIQLKENATK